MRLTRTPTLLTVLLPLTLAAPPPWPFTNTTTSAVDKSSSDTLSSDTTSSDTPPSDTTTIPTNETDITNTTLSSSLSGGPYICNCAYPSDLTVMNSRYPDYAHHLHAAHRFFMLRRQTPALGEIATRVQFTSLPPKSSNTTCRLEFIVPSPSTQVISGANPSFNVWSVVRPAGERANWDTYEGYKDDTKLFGVANGEQAALERIRANGGVAALGEDPCAETMTWQMGMLFDGPEKPNY
jgi:hypothetical protein